MSFTSEVRSFGHNLSHTNYILEKEKCTFGLQVIGCKIKKSFLGISPFLYAFYNMHNLYYRLNLNSNGTYRNSIELAYFKTFDDDERPKESSSIFDKIYKMEAVWIYYIFTFNISNGYKLHLNTIGNYYSDDERPFSLRRPTIERNPFQLNISSLHEINLSKHFDLLAEIGALHVLDEYPRVHMGTSFLYKNGKFSAQLGFTFSTTLNGLIIDSANPIRRDLQQFLIYQEAGYKSEYTTRENLIKQDFAIHPEVAIQYNF